MKFTIPADRNELKQQVLSYVARMGFTVSSELSGNLSARYLPGDSAAEASVAVRILSVNTELIEQFEAMMDAVGADIRKRDDLQTIRLDNWPARWASTLSNEPFVYIAGPKQDESIFVQFFADTGDIPASIYHDHPDGKVFRLQHGVPS